MTPSDDDRAFELVNGFRASALVQLACELGLPDRLAEGARGAADLAAAAGVLEDPLRRVLRALASMGIVEESSPGTYALTALGSRFLDRPGSYRAAALSLPQESSDAFREVHHSLETGRPGHEKAFGTSRWERLSGEPGAADAFQRFMVATSEQVAPALLAGHDFSAAKQVVDVGGGHGGLIAAVLAAHPQSQGVVLDLPPALAGAEEHLERKGVADRCTLVRGDFFESVPAGADAYLLKFILHDWYEDDCVRILRSCRAAMHPGSELLVVDRILPEVATPADLRSFMADIQMLVVIGGRERTLSEFEALFSAAGLALASTVELGAGISLLVARAA